MYYPEDMNGRGASIMKDRDADRDGVQATMSVSSGGRVGASPLMHVLEGGGSGTITYAHVTLAHKPKTNSASDTRED